MMRSWLVELEIDKMPTGYWRVKYNATYSVIPTNRMGPNKDRETSEHRRPVN